MSANKHSTKAGSKRSTRPRAASRKADWSAFDATTDEQIATQIDQDANTAPELDEAWFARAQAVEPVVKIPISLRVDPDVLEWFRRGGSRYQSRMNAVLRAYMDHMLDR